MAKINWNDFVTTHPGCATFASTVSASLPNGPVLDRNNKKLPTPYGLFVEWAGANLTGDWAVMKVAGGFYISVSQNLDAEIISEKFGVTNQTKKTPASDKTFCVNYRDSNYGALARSLGYAI